MNRIQYISILLLGWMMLLQQNVLAQQTDSLEIHTIKGKPYYIHVVSKGESLYAIHKKYEVPIEVIKKENQGVLDGLSIGEKIFIPVIEKEEEITPTNGNHIQHKVLPKQTLYAIAKIYQLSVKEIMAANPGMDENIEEGQLINIPVKQIKADRDTVRKALSNAKWKIHEVKKKETLYSLSKLYNVTVDSIKIVNNGLSEGLKEGEKIFIPIKQPSKNLMQLSKDTLSATLAEILQQAYDSTGKKSFKIALLLPYYVKNNQELIENLSAIEGKKVYPKSRFAVEFYHGFLFALDSLAKDDYQVELLVYDTNGEDSLTTQNIIKQLKATTPDLIVGPLYTSNFEQVAAFGKAHHIPVISPVKQPNKVLLGNEMALKVIPSQANSVNCIAKLLVDSFRTDNIIAVEHASSPEKMLVDLLAKAYKERMLTNTKDTLAFAAIKKLKIDRNFSEITAKLLPNKNNIVFVPSANQGYVTDLFNFLTTLLNRNDYKDYTITLIGLEQWMNYENIELSSYELLNVYLPVHSYINYNDSATAHVIDQFVLKYEFFPSTTSLLGFDLGYYFIKGMMEHQTVINTVLVQKEVYHGISMDIMFKKTGIESGFENQSSFMVNYNNYELKRVY